MDFAICFCFQDSKLGPSVNKELARLQFIGAGPKVAVFDTEDLDEGGRCIMGTDLPQPFHASSNRKLNISKYKKQACFHVIYDN